MINNKLYCKKYSTQKLKTMQSLNSSFHLYNLWNSNFMLLQSAKFNIFSFQRPQEMKKIISVKVFQNPSSQFNQNFSENIDKEKEVKIQEQIQNKDKNSVFHNFLKHLIITLKQNISEENIEKQAKKIGYDSQLSTKIWNQFIKSKNYSKKMLMMIVGSSNNNYKIQQKINNFLNSSKKQKYSRAQVNRSQQLFRKIITEMFTGDKLQNILKNRKFQNLEHFKEYFSCFIKELTSKCINKRLTKQDKQKILRQEHFQR